MRFWDALLKGLLVLEDSVPPPSEYYNFLKHLP